jgi:hypothetical protein
MARTLAQRACKVSIKASKQGVAAKAQASARHSQIDSEDDVMPQRSPPQPKTHVFSSERWPERAIGEAFAWGSGPRKCGSNKKVI